MNLPFSSEKARKELGYQPGSARRALAKSVNWFLRAGQGSERYLGVIQRDGALDAALSDADG